MVRRQQVKQLPYADEGYDNLTTLWSLRTLLHTGIFEKLANSYVHAYEARRLFTPTEDELIVRSATNHMIDPIVLANVCRAKFDKLQRKRIARNGVLFENIRVLSKSLDLSPTQQDILALRALYRIDEVLRGVLDFHYNITTEKLTRILSKIFRYPRREIETAISMNSALMRSGLVRISLTANEKFEGKLQIMCGLVNVLFRANGSLEELIGFATHRAPHPTLKTEDFVHLAEEQELLGCYLQQVQMEALKGVNILVYGPPGVGKTEFVRVITKRFNVQLFEVNCSDEDRRALKPSDRMDHYVLNQSLLAKNRQAVILFDEIEDVIPDRLPTFRNDEKASAIDKAWMNRLLEENPVPAFWVANKIHHMDPALLRRFDYVMEMRVPPHSVRRRILESSLKGLKLPQKWLEEQALERWLSPAVAARTARVIKKAGELNPESVTKHFERMVKNSLTGQGHEVDVTRHPMPENYSLEFVNANTDLVALSKMLADRKRNGNVLLYGPPGTGKTAFAHHLAMTLDRPLMLRRASELLSMWVGGTEKNLARMFNEALEDGALLLLDEADSFLQDRSMAQRTWEITQVNELLTRMEGFEGIFLCATNMFDRLDSAAMRRFGLKVQFDYLNPDQRRRMFLDTLKILGGAPGQENLSSEIRSRLDHLTNLAPGDFVVITQQWSLSDTSISPHSLLKSLEQESRLKPGVKTRLGFIA